MGNTNAPWNKGKKGIEAGWTEARRKLYSDRQKAYLKAHPENPFGRAGERPDTWITGPDRAVKQHRIRWTRMKAQAKFWGQEWSISWEDYLDLYKTMTGEWGRTKDSQNLTRVDTSEGWHVWNVKLMERGEAMKRRSTNKRIVPKGQGSKARGIKWKRNNDS